LITILGLREINSVPKPQNKKMNPIPELRRNNCTYNGKRDIIQIKERKSNCTAVSFRW